MVDFHNKILPLLQKEESLKQFKFLKKYNSLRQKTDFGFYNIEFYTHKSYDIERDNPALQVYPVFGVRFDIVTKWFEKFSFKSVSDQRNNSTVFADGKAFDKQDKFYFLDSGQGFENDYSNFRNKVIDVSTYYFSKYRSIDDYFSNDVLPVLNKEQEMYDIGADWIFEYLAAVKLCQFDRYDEMTNLLKDQIKFMNSRNEPNVSMYNDKFDYIFKELRGIELRK